MGAKISQLTISPAQRTWEYRQRVRNVTNFDNLKRLNSEETLSPIFILYY